ncbi:MAG: hypothetical protein KKD05_08730 [Candidatus Omnitrophica bacterium]|nr:hypothetical protein [Candidatus Omnitrophota bacterium]
MRIVRFEVIVFLLILLIFSILIWGFQKTVSPIKDGLCLKYITTLCSVKDNNVSEHNLLFKKKNKNYYQVDFKSTGFLENQQTYIVDKNLLDATGMALPGPTAAVLWIAPALLSIGNNLAAGEVIKFTIWKGYSVAVVQDPALANCYGFYDRKTGIQVGYMNCFSSNKLLTVIKAIDYNQVI